ncbi:MAG TPA: phenol hydroxylase subunit P4 [Azonexus sp.]|nr:phenol hydroxylase subunit P4 [Azonexus sp.]
MTMLKTLAPYEFKSRDAVENYKGRQLLYVNWERHRMFSRPFVLAMKPETPFSAVLEEMAACFSYHPDWQHIDWDKAIWQNGNTPFTPDRNKTLAENGIGHKDLIRFRTPGLDGIAGTGY